MRTLLILVVLGWLSGVAAAQIELGAEGTYYDFQRGEYITIRPNGRRPVVKYAAPGRGFSAVRLDSFFVRKAPCSIQDTKAEELVLIDTTCMERVFEVTTADSTAGTFIIASRMSSYRIVYLESRSIQGKPLGFFVPLDRAIYREPNPERLLGSWLGGADCSAGSLLLKIRARGTRVSVWWQPTGERERKLEQVSDPRRSGRLVYRDPVSQKLILLEPGGDLLEKYVSVTLPDRSPTFCNCNWPGP